MKTNLRFDSISMQTLERGHDFSRYKAILAKPGVMSYDGVNEFIPPEELFSEETIKSFRGVPLIDTDQNNFHEFEVNSENYRKHLIGSVGDNIREEDGALVAEITVYDKDANAAIETGEKMQLSICRKAEMENRSGVYGSLPYQVIQKNLRGNHVALTFRGRAGAKVGIMNRADSNPQGETMIIVKYRADSDGKDHDIPDAVAKDITDTKTKLDASTKELTETKTKLTELETKIKELETKNPSPELDKLKAELELSKSLLAVKDSEVKAWQTKLDEAIKAEPAKVEALANERTELEQNGKAIIGDSFVSKGKTNSQIKDEIIANILPFKDGLKSDSISTELRNAHYEAALNLARAKASVDPKFGKQKETKADTDDYRKNMHNKSGEKK